MSTTQDPREPGHRVVPPADRTGLLIIRAWVEKGSSEPLRAQVRLVADVSDGLEQTLILSRSEAVTAVVQGWLAGILSDAQVD